VSPNGSVKGEGVVVMIQFINPLFPGGEGQGEVRGIPQIIEQLPI